MTRVESAKPSHKVAQKISTLFVDVITKPTTMRVMQTQQAFRSNPKANAAAPA
jgi:hypothetical protein